MGLRESLIFLALREVAFPEGFRGSVSGDEFDCDVRIITGETTSADLRRTSAKLEETVYIYIEIDR